MGTNKTLLNHGVITRGSANRRVVLDYDAGLIYLYREPERVTAVFEKGKGWITPEAPHYYRGGWGNPGSGDADGSYIADNTRDLLRSIGAKVYELNSPVFLTPAEQRELSKSIRENNRLAEKQTKLAEKLKATTLTVEPIKAIPNFTLKLVTNRYGEKTPFKGLKGMDPIKVTKQYNKALEVFKNAKGKPVKIDSYVISANFVKQDKTTVAFRDSQGQVFLNSQMLEVSDFEREFLGGESLIQKELKSLAKYSIPFNVLESASLKLSETQVIDTGPEGTYQVFTNSYGNGPKSDRHFTGALLLENDGRKFLMDIDRREIEHGIFNAFFVEVTKNVKNISEAYESMMPSEVKKAIADKIKVERQGEWFFIATDKTLTVKDDQIKNWDRSEKETNIVLRSNVSHGKGRPNTLYKPVGFGELDQYVCGVVTHSGREHKDLDLGVKQNEKKETTTYNLWKLIPNTTIGNFTIKGDID